MDPLALFALLPLVPLAPLQEEAPGEDPGLRRQLDELAERLRERRGHNLEDSVPVERLGPDAFRSALERQLRELRPEGHFGHLAEALRLLGGLPPDFDGDLEQIIVDDLAANVFGLYSPTRRVILVPERGEVPAAVVATAEAFRREILAHELEHAIQDRDGAVGRGLGRAAVNNDARMAASALFEGDAVCAAMDVMLGDAGSSILEFDGDIGARVRDQIELNSVMDAAKSGFLADPSGRVFEYADGAGFVQRLLGLGGWERVDRALADLPLSTEQVLHPEKYLEARDWPVEVALEPTAAMLDAGWTLSAADTLGEFGLRELIAAELEGAELVKATFGWDGDRWLLLEREGRSALVWGSAWDSRTDARQAFASLMGVYGLRPARDGSIAYSEEGEVGPVLLGRDGDRVALCVGLPLEVIDGAPTGPDALGALDAALKAPVVHHPSDEEKGRGDRRSTRRLEKEAIEALDAASIVVDGRTVTIRDLGMTFELPGDDWTVETDTPMASIRVICKQGTGEVNFNVLTAPAQGLSPAEMLEATIAFAEQNFQDLEVQRQVTRDDDPRGPAMDARYSADVGPARGWFWQLGFLRGDEFVVMTCTSMGEPIEGEVAEAFQGMLDGATFVADPK